MELSVYVLSVYETWCSILPDTNYLDPSNINSIPQTNILGYFKNKLESLALIWTRIARISSGKHTNQISANNSTTLCFSKITRYSILFDHKLKSLFIFWEIIDANTNKLVLWEKLVFTPISICVWTLILKRVRTGLVFVLRLYTILGFQYWALSRPRTQTFKIRLENKSRVRTLLRQNLIQIYESRSKRRYESAQNEKWGCRNR